MMQNVQLSIADPVYGLAIREALVHSCAWHVQPAAEPDPALHGVMVLDWAAFCKLPLPLDNPERVVLIGPQEPQVLAQAWDAGIVSVVSQGDPIDTVLMAIMAAALRVDKSHSRAAAREISPTIGPEPAPIPPQHRSLGSRRCKIQ
ncbi:MAG: hypothetical protein KGN36_12855 [Acidobacteriota bacterium]|nr:hypothetical protein [Acidobacteriota bacterium]